MPSLLILHHVASVNWCGIASSKTTRHHPVHSYRRLISRTGSTRSDHSLFGTVARYLHVPTASARDGQAVEVEIKPYARETVTTPPVTRSARLRWIGLILIMLATAGSIACSINVDRDGPPPEPPKVRWLLTSDGWERSLANTPRPAIYSPSLHPTLIAAGMAIASLFALVASSPDEYTAPSRRETKGIRRPK